MTKRDFNKVAKQKNTSSSKIAEMTKGIQNGSYLHQGAPRGMSANKCNKSDPQ